MTSTERCDEIIALIDRVLIETDPAPESFTGRRTGPCTRGETAGRVGRDRSLS